MRKTMVAMAAAMAVVCARAEAYPVTYTLTDTVYDAGAMDARGLKNGDPLGFSLTIDSAAVAKGSFTLKTNYPQNLGDATYFISASTPFEGVSATNFFTNYIDVGLRFDQTGLVTAGRIDLGGLDSGITLTGTGNLLSGSFGGDGTRCGICNVSGRLVTSGYVPTSVPEPFSLALLASGVLALGIARRRA